MNWKRACRQTSKVVKMVRGKRVFATGVYFIWHFKNFQQWKIKLPRIRLTAADRGRRWWNSGLGRWLFSGARWRPPVWSSLPGTSALALWSHRRAGCWNHKGFSLTGGLGRSICILALLVLQSSFAWWIGVCPLAPMTKCSLVGVISWPKYWSFSISPSIEYLRLISFRIDWFDLLEVQGTLESFPTP